MAQDVKILKDDDGIFDIPTGTDYESVDGIETAIIATVFTEARADVGAVPDSFDRRGWVGNLLTLSDDYELGSKLWTYSQAKLTTNTLNSISDLVKKSLNWLIEDGIADTIEVSSSVAGTRGVAISIDLYKNRNSVGRYITVWDNTREQ